MLITQRVLTAVEELAEVDSVGELMLTGLSGPIAPFNPLNLKH